LSAHCILVTQDPKTRRGIDVAVLKSRLPNTFAYLKRFERQLSTRSGYLKYFRPDTDPFYSVYNVGPESFAPLKTVWKTMGPRIEAAVLEPMAHRALPRKVPFHKNTVMFIPLTRDDEAHYLAAVLNSAALTFAAKSYSVKGGKGFGATNLLEYVRIPKFLPKERVHTKLAELSQRAHDLASRLVTKPDDKEAKRELAQVEDQVDRAAAALWGLTDAELDEIRKALELLS
jgi:ribosomal protein S15P/S13E